MRQALIALVLVLSLSLPATANPIFADNFNAQNAGVGSLNFNAFTGWNVTNGTVDLIGNGYFDLLPGNGLYVDLDGSSGTPGTIQTQTSFAAGTYTLTFDLAGNQRNNETDTVTITLGNWTDSVTVSQLDPFTTFTRTFTTTGGSLVFQNSAGTIANEGALLDNVSLSAAIPEPATLAVFGGLALAGLAGYRRRKAKAVA